MKFTLPLFLALTISVSAAEPKAFINGTGPGWRAMTEADFTNVNCKPDTWTFGKDGLIHVHRQTGGGDTHEKAGDQS